MDDDESVFMFLYLRVNVLDHRCRVVVPAAGVARGVRINVLLQIDTVAVNQISRVAVRRSTDRGLT